MREFLVQKPPLWKGVSADKVLSPDNPIQQLVRRTIEEEIVDTSTRVKCVDVWCNFLEMCEDHWRTESDVLLGVSGISPLLAPVFFFGRCLCKASRNPRVECADVHFNLQ